MIPPPSRDTAPPILKRAGTLLSRYDVIFCDVWGVVHDGLRAYEPACDALLTFRERHGTVILVSNAPVPEHRVAAMLDSRRVPRDAWDAIVSSGVTSPRRATSTSTTSARATATPRSSKNPRPSPWTWRTRRRWSAPA